MAAAALRRAMNAFTRPPDPTDADLLRQFADGRSETAFAALVRRHGPLVLGVCRRVVPDRHLAEDAFQAAFVVLARRADGIDPNRPLGPWLYGVAHRVALRARTMIGRRRKRETLAAGVPEVPHTLPVVDDTTAILDEEIAALPDAIREAVILCELQGLSRREAAKRLGIAEGTLSSRLAAARKVLAAKLRSRGVALTAALAGAAVLSPDLASAAVAAATGVSLSSVVVSLADGASAMTLLNKLKLTGVAVLFLLLSAGGVGPWGANQSSAAPVPKAAPPEGVIVVSKLSFKPPNAVLEVMDTAGKSLSYLAVGDLDNVQRARVSPDGRRLAFVRFIPLNGNQKGLHEYPQDVYVVELPIKEAPTEPTFKALLDPQFAWAPDGNTLFVSSITDDTNMKQAAVVGNLLPRKTVKYDAAAKKEKEIELPKGHTVQDVSPDGKTFLTRTKVWNGGRGKTGYSSFLVPLDTLKPQAIGDEDDGFEIARFSPDGTRVAGTRPPLSKSKDHGVFIADVAKGKIEPVPLAKEVVAGLDAGCVAWAPDGKRLAVMWMGPAKGGGQPGIGGGGGPGGQAMAKRITLVDTNGKNDKTIREFAANEYALHIEWADPKLDDPKKDEPKTKPPAREPIKAPVPKEKPDDGVIWTHNIRTNTLTAYTPAGKEEKALKLPDGLRFIGFTPDGARLVFAGKKGKVSTDRDGLTVHVGPIDDSGTGTDTGLGWVASDQFIWSPDQKQIVRQRLAALAGPGGPKPKKHEFVHTLFDITTRKETEIGLPADHQIMQWSADGKTWRVLHGNFGQNPKLPNYRWLTTPAGGKPDLKPMCDTLSLSWVEPDAVGTGFIAVGRPHPAKGNATTQTLFTVSDGKADEIATLTTVAFVALRRSHDGRQVVCAKYEYDAQNPAANGTVLVRFDADGKNEQQLLTVPNDNQQTRLLGWFPSDPKAKK